MLNIVLFGAPGSGKGTQSAKLIDEYSLYHISTGEVLRAEIASGSELGKLADSYISKGNLIPDELMINILDGILAEHLKDREGIVFDGFPRTIPQAEALTELLRKHGTELHAVVGLEVPEEELVQRMIKRGKEDGYKYADRLEEHLPVMPKSEIFIESDTHGEHAGHHEYDNEGVGEFGKQLLDPGGLFALAQHIGTISLAAFPHLCLGEALILTYVRHKFLSNNRKK